MGGRDLNGGSKAWLECHTAANHVQWRNMGTMIVRVTKRDENGKATELSFFGGMSQEGLRIESPDMVMAAQYDGDEMAKTDLDRLPQDEGWQLATPKNARSSM